MRYLINIWKLKNPQPPSQKKNHPSPFLLTPPLKIQKLQFSPLFGNIEGGGGLEDTLLSLARMMVSFFPILV